MGHRLVIQHISFGAFSDATISYALARTNFSSASSFFIAGGFEGNAAADHPVLGYVDEGSAASLDITVHTTAPPTITDVQVSIMGYLLDCTSVTPCNPIAGQ